jgi:hypothetical protein
MSFLNDRKFAKEGLEDFVETQAVITESHVESEEFYEDSEKDSDGDIKRRFMQYRVHYEYTAEYETPDGVMLYESYGSNEGTTSRNATAIPESAYEIPQPGDEVTILYNIYYPEQTRGGGKEHWEELGAFSFTNLFFPGILLLIALFFGYKDFKLNIYKPKRKDSIL